MGKHIGEVLPEKRDRISLELQDARNDFDKFADNLLLGKLYFLKKSTVFSKKYLEIKEFVDNERIKQRKVNQ